MCEPVTLTILATTAVASAGAGATVGATAALAVAGIGMGIAGTAYSMAAQKEAGDYQKQVADNNATVAEMQAGQRLDVAREEKRKLGRDVGKARGQGTVGFAAGNVALGSGSVMDWEADLSETAQLSYDNIDYNAALDVWGFENQAANSRDEGELAKYSAKQKMIATGISGVGNAMTQGALTAKTFGWGGGAPGSGGGADLRA